ncbi:MAG TPA: AI-2E family transporter [Candidatus Limnocylindrales bacterium]|jgi:predicted PurR-regulated permease PerM|nr:AI-2E family transporter [Candidatus Limnocylindrales bacterium]
MTEIAPPMPERNGLVPGWLQRLAAVGWRLLATIALGLVLIRIAVLLGTVTASILVAAIVAATFAPFVLALRDRGWSRIKAAGVVFLGAMAVIIATIAIIVIAFLPAISSVVDGITTGVASLKSLLAGLDIPPEVGAAIDHATQGLQAWISSEVSELVGTIGTVATVALLATFLTFFFMMDGDKAWGWAMASTSPWRREAIATAGDVALARVGGYLRGTAVIAAFDGFFEALFLVILGVPNAPALGVIVFLGRFIPYIGGLVTTIIVLFATLASVGQTAAIVLLVLIAILDIIQGKFLAPIVYHRTVHIHPALVLIALPAGAALAGIIGLFVAIPVVAFALAIVGALVSILGVGPDARAISTDPMVPVWLDRLGQWSWRLLVSIGLLAVFVGVVVAVPIVVIPLVLGVVLAATLAPLAGGLERRGWSHDRAALGATVGAALGIVILVGLTLISLAAPVSDAINSAVSGAGSADSSTGGQAGILVTLVQTFGVGILVTIAGFLSTLAGVAVILLLATLLTFYFMRDGGAFWQAFLGRVEPGRRSHVAAAGRRAFDVLGGYMLGTGAISLFGAATQFLIMVILGIPFALPLAVLAVFGGFIPYIGSIITTGLAFLVTVATGSPQDIAIMAIFTIVFNIVQGNIVAPVVYSRVVSIHPAVVLVAIPAGNEIAGVIGMFLVVPFLGVVAATWRTVLRVLDTKPVDAVDADAAAAAEPAELVPTVAPTGG